MSSYTIRIGVFSTLLLLLACGGSIADDEFSRASGADANPGRAQADGGQGTGPGPRLSESGAPIPTLPGAGDDAGPAPDGGSSPVDAALWSPGQGDAPADSLTPREAGGDGAATVAQDAGTDGSRITPRDGGTDGSPVIPQDASSDASTVPPTVVAVTTLEHFSDPFSPGSETYTASVDPTTVVQGSPTMLLQSTSSTTETSWSATGGSFRVDSSYWNKRYRMRAMVKTESAQYGFLWFRIDMPRSGYVLDNMLDPVDRSLNGTTDFREVSLVLDVPERAFEFSYGSGLVGTGKIWVGPITFEEVDQSVPTTPYTFGGASQ